MSLTPWHDRSRLMSATRSSNFSGLLGPTPCPGIPYLLPDGREHLCERQVRLQCSAEHMYICSGEKDRVCRVVISRSELVLALAFVGLSPIRMIRSRSLSLESGPTANRVSTAYTQDAFVNGFRHGPTKTKTKHLFGLHEVRKIHRMSASDRS